MIETVFKTVLRTMRVTTLGKPEAWEDDARLYRLAAIINHTPNGTTGYSPFAVLYGFNADGLDVGDLPARQENIDAVASYHEQLLAIQEVVFFRSALGQLVNKGRFDARNRPPPRAFVKGEFVLVLEEQRIGGKLGTQYKGPYVVVRAEPSDMYVVHRLFAPATTFTRHVSRIVAFDMALTSEAAEATRMLGGGDDGERYGIVGAIHAHTRRADGGYDFSVSWSGSPDGPTSVCGFNLKKTKPFKDYIAAAGLDPKEAGKKPA